MKAFKVFYSTGTKDSSMVVLAKDKEGLREAVANKDIGFDLDNPHAKIGVNYEIPISNVMVSDLSVTELLSLMASN